MRPDRSTESVDRLVAALKDALSVYPDLRVGQILMNAEPCNLFNTENDKLTTALREMVGRNKKAPKVEGICIEDESGKHDWVWDDDYDQNHGYAAMTTMVCYDCGAKE
jgi:hypothetical protein